jgi:O-antigen ligase
MNRTLNGFFLFTLYAFVSVAIKSNVVDFAVNVRWVVLLLLGWQVIVARKMGINIRFFSLILLYVSWCFTTYFWSEIPQLTLMKSAALFVMAFSMSLSGYSWSMRNQREKVFDFLLPVAVVTLLASILGVNNDEGFMSPNKGLRLFQGLTGNPNMLGILTSMTLPYVLWQVFKNRTKPYRNMFWIFVCACIMALLFFTLSRASILMAFMIQGGFLLAFQLRRIMLVSYIGCLLLAGLYITVPEMKDRLEDKIIYKFSTPEQGFFLSRKWIWQESYEQAKLGGVFGGGYGITIGMSEWQEAGLSSVNYGREKGNSQLAIVEETGIVGLLLYALLLVLLLGYLFKAFRSASYGNDKTALGLALGTLSGMIAHSAFEAWWDAPGSPEFVVFWATAGVGLGLADLVLGKKDKKQRNIYQTHSVRWRREFSSAYEIERKGA